MVSSTANSHVLNVVRHVENKKNSHVNQHHHSISHPIKKTLTDVINSNVSVLPGLLLQVGPAVYGVADHQPSCKVHFDYPHPSLREVIPLKQKTF